MHVSSILAALAAATTLVDANPLNFRLKPRADVSTTCSYALPSKTASNLHCGVYGTLQKKLINLLYTVGDKEFGNCRDTCINENACISFGYNATSSECSIYGKNLVSFDVHIVLDHKSREILGENVVRTSADIHD